MNIGKCSLSFTFDFGFNLSNCIIEIFFNWSFNILLTQSIVQEIFVFFTQFLSKSLENNFRLCSLILLDNIFKNVHCSINFSSSNIILNIFFIHNTFRYVGIIDGFMDVEGLTVDMTLILESMKEWTDISQWIIFAFESNTSYKVFIMINISGFWDKTLRSKL